MKEAQFAIFPAISAVFLDFFFHSTHSTNNNMPEVEDHSNISNSVVNLKDIKIYQMDRLVSSRYTVIHHPQATSGD